MKIVLDTNVLVSAFLSANGNAARILDSILIGNHTLLFDDRILAEYNEVIARPKFRLNKQYAHTVLDFIVSEGEFIVPDALAVKLDDLDDLPFVEVAVQASKNISEVISQVNMSVPIVTGNKKHFPAKLIARVKCNVLVVSPAEFVAEFLGLK